MGADTKYKVVISDRAKQMLAEHIAFLAKVNKATARKKKNQLITAMYSLETFPERYPFFENAYMPKGKYHKMFIENWYLVLHQIKDMRVEVDYILDTRKENNWQ